MDWIKKQISIAHQGIANAAENSSVESETYPINNKGILIMYCHVIKEDAKIQKNLHLDFYSGQVYFTKGNALVKSFSCSDISKITLLNDLLVVEYKKKYQMTMRSKRMLFCSNFEALQMRNHLQFIGESGVMLRELFVLIDRESIDSIQPVDLKYAFKFHDLQVSDEQCQRM